MSVDLGGDGDSHKHTGMLHLLLCTRRNRDFVKYGTKLFLVGIIVGLLLDCFNDIFCRHVLLCGPGIELLLDMLFCY